VWALKGWRDGGGGAPFSRAEMQTMLDLAQSGIAQLIAAQRAALG
jgi:ribonuclease PH